MQDWISGPQMLAAQKLADAELNAQLAQMSVADEVDKACRMWKIRDARMQELLRKFEALVTNIDLSSHVTWNDWLFRRDVLLKEIADLLNPTDCNRG